MRRRTFDALATTAGLLLAAVLLIAGILLGWAHSFVTSEVHSQLASQKIEFPTTTNPEFKALPKADAAAMRQYAGQQMTTGAQAETYADHFIAYHLSLIGVARSTLSCPRCHWPSPPTPSWLARSRPSSVATRCAACY
jgi:hypothetical protein